MSKKLFFIGGGNMAWAILGGLDRAAWNVVVSEIIPERRLETENKFSVQTVEKCVPEINTSDVVLFAVKPQQLDSVLEELKGVDMSGKTIISIMAGIPLRVLKSNMTGDNIKFVRTMPNTPLLVGKGVTGVYCEEPESMTVIDELLASMSKIIQVPCEDDLNKITALSGSGPAYFFLFIEAMRNAAKDMGFDDQMASDMALGTCLGAAVLASNSTTDVSVLREQVTSKGGTTERALAVFNEEGLENIMKKATKAALDRAVELGQK
eukprot:TRINITY_DN15147_c0_g1_i1.p1 TRINITY_DN15147_c0_g1~~TRINITY_DN15147_c0_g1_i1.p1  ORF type:complete len:265 (-),score=76.01 TRINITY_DN15147_c0_g1_i1:84-878(-)